VRRVLRAALLGLAAVACSTRATPRVVGAPSGPAAPDASSPLRVAIVVAAPTISATTEFRWSEGGSSLLARGRRGEAWTLERQRGRDRVRAVRPDGSATDWSPALVGEAGGDGFMTVNGVRYRGQLTVVPHGDTLAVINQVPLEEYLRSVVAVEMGQRIARDSSALQAQAVAARSYAVIRMGGGSRDRGFDVYSSVLDQAYRGMDVENSAATAAVERTRGLVLFHDGRVADAVYSSTCGGSTAEPAEVWRNPGAPYLQRVSDRIGDSDRYYCDIAPRFRWIQEMSHAELDANLAQYLARYAAVPAGGPGRARQLFIADTTPSGRVGTLMVETDRGSFALRGNDIRFVMRTSGGAILNSTYFSVESKQADGGLAGGVVFRGRGYGHGIGMCQWGAIGRARAGQSFRTILATYYPGTSLGLLQ
jgi:stage II sporulation protein D